uniref:P4Hc domain-containing protein n=1 Tax=Soboliphyme baturini TaxID=241478 RepID=A0A183IHW0_9BILA
MYYTPEFNRLSGLLSHYFKLIYRLEKTEALRSAKEINILGDIATATKQKRGTLTLAKRITVTVEQLWSGMISVLCVVVTIVWASRVTTGELFSSMANVDALLETEQAVVDIIDSYIANERRRLLHLEQIAKEYRQRNLAELNSGEGNQMIINPIQAFLLIRRLTDEWANTEQLMHATAAEGFLQNITLMRERSSVKFPEVDDFEGAAIALMRIQDVYQLGTHDMAEGRIKNVRRGHRMDALDCFSVGRVAYQKRDYYHTMMWMQEALDRVRNEYPPTADEAEILEYLAFALFQQGNVQHALHTTRILLDMRPKHVLAAKNIKYYENMLDPESQGDKTRLDESRLPPIQNLRPNDTHVPEREEYESLCRKAGLPMVSVLDRSHFILHCSFTDIPPFVAKDLYCYLKRDIPFLKLAPIKVEVVHWKPKIMFFRRIVSDDELAVIKQLALPLVITDLRLNAWLQDKDNPVVTRLTQRTEDMTGLNMKTSELLQRGEKDPYRITLGNRIASVLFYINDSHSFQSLGTGNRIGSVLFYLSQPDAGGGTVFPTLKTSISASKNDAIFWHNLKRSGEPDESTLHAACPVLAGSKWVGNRWMHERGQEFIRPCTLKENDYE